MTYCKNCIFWNIYQGNEVTLPKRNAHACTVRIHEYVDKDGDTAFAVTALAVVKEIDQKKKLVQEIPTKPGPFYGERTKPKFSCGAGRAKHKPKIKATIPAIPSIQK